MKNLNHTKLKELSNQELINVEGGGLLSDLKDAYDAAKALYESLKRFTPIA